jgi:hypothetical protein
MSVPAITLEQNKEFSLNLVDYLAIKGLPMFLHFTYLPLVQSSMLAELLRGRDITT